MFQKLVRSPVGLRIGLAALTAATVLGAAAPAMAQDGDQSLLTKAKSAFKIYGFVRIDAIYDDARFNDTQIAGRVLPGGGANDSADFSMTPRLSRLGLDLDAGTIADLWDAKLTGNIEVDFYDFNTSDSRNRIRMRKAYMRLTWDNFFFQAGQDADVISPRFPAVNADLVMWNAGNLGDRRPQLRSELWFDQGDMTFRFQQAFGLTGAVSGADRDTNGLLDGEASATPTIQARASMAMPLLTKAKKFELGVYAHTAREKLDAPIGPGAGRHWFSSYAFGMDMELPIYEDIFSITGEAWFGKNLSDVRGGLFQDVNAATGEEVRARGGWVQANLKASKNINVHVGYSLDDPQNGDVPAAPGATENRIMYIASTYKAGAFTIGAEFLNWVTRYAAAPEGEANRIKVYFSYGF